MSNDLKKLLSFWDDFIEDESRLHVDASIINTFLFEKLEGRASLPLLQIVGLQVPYILQTTITCEHTSQDILPSKNIAHLIY